MSDVTTIELGGEQYLVRPEGGVLKIGRPAGKDVTWLDDLDLGLLPEPARAAVESGDLTHADLTQALLGVVQAEVHRGA
jgi:gentisate 1,2-dioxygenase